LPRRRDRRRPCRLRRRTGARSARSRQRTGQEMGRHVSSTGTLPADEVRSMFDRIAPVYDVMNRVMTAGLDLRWRRIAAESVVRPGVRGLDASRGTGELAVAASKAGGNATGLAFSPRMLERARRKLPSATWVEGDLLGLPFEDVSFDVPTVGFGVRNVADLEGSLAELRRGLTSGGRVAVL